MTISSGSATLVKGVANGSVSGGAISIPGLAVGDALVLVSPNGFADGFEQTVSIANQIQQLSPLDWSSVSFTFYLLRGV